MTKNFFERNLGQGLRPRTPFRSVERPKALPLESTSFLKKAGQKLLVSVFALLMHFFTCPTALIRLILKTGGGNLPQKAGQKLLVSLLYLLRIFFLMARPL
ncbi:MAG: hypothetical protein ACI4JM_13020 [Oscillospiraceae bacterium]